MRRPSPVVPAPLARCPAPRAPWSPSEAREHVRAAAYRLEVELASPERAARLRELPERAYEDPGAFERAWERALAG